MPNGEQTVVLQDGGFGLAEGHSDPPIFLEVVGHAAEVVVDGVVFEERARVLRDRLERDAQAGECLAVRGVGMGSGHDIGAGGVHLGVDDERGPVDWTVTVQDVPLVADLDQVGHRDLGEAHTERVDPERVRVLGVPGRDAPGYALGEVESAKDPEGRGELTLVVRVFLPHRQPVRDMARLSSAPVAEPTTTGAVMGDISSTLIPDRVGYVLVSDTFL